jgi:hypothetical protein
MERVQKIEGHAKSAGGKQRIPVKVAFESAGFAHQPVNDVAVVDQMLSPAPQARQTLNLARALLSRILADYHPLVPDISRTNNSSP